MVQLLSLAPTSASLSCVLAAPRAPPRAPLISAKACPRSSLLAAHSPLKSVPSARFSPRSARLLRTPPHGPTAASRGGSARARGKGDGEADPRERAEPVEAEIVGEDEWDQWRGRGGGSGSGMRGAQGGFDLDERERMRGMGAEELPPGWDSADVFLLEENVPAAVDDTVVLTGAMVVGWGCQSGLQRLCRSTFPPSYCPPCSLPPTPLDPLSGLCQPWTIVLTGAMVVGMSWAVLHFIFLTVIVAAAIGVWWLTFLVAYPAVSKHTFSL
ncbi:unnamed protein product [Closterium sp. Naga37s-1]|nr:unnamed protein product [Closterium sp. Naga37s-1]